MHLQNELIFQRRCEDDEMDAELVQAQNDYHADVKMFRQILWEASETIDSALKKVRAADEDTGTRMIMRCADLQEMAESKGIRLNSNLVQEKEIPRLAGMRVSSTNVPRVAIPRLARAPTGPTSGTPTLTKRKRTPRRSKFDIPLDQYKPLHPYATPDSTVCGSPHVTPAPEPAGQVVQQSVETPVATSAPTPAPPQKKHQPESDGVLEARRKLVAQREEREARQQAAQQARDIAAGMRHLEKKSEMTPAELEKLGWTPLTNEELQTLGLPPRPVKES